MATACMIQVLLVDDHTMVRQGLRTVLQTYPNIEILGEASDGEEAILKVRHLRPAVVVMDITMPKMDGITATRVIKTQYPHIAIVGLSVTAQSYQVDAMVKAGAIEIITKDKAVDDLYGAIQRAVAAIQPILILQEALTATSEERTQKSENPSNALPLKDVER